RRHRTIVMGDIGPVSGEALANAPAFQQWQLVVEPGWQVSADSADGLFDDIGVVEQPFCRWRDALPALLCKVQDMHDLADTLGVFLRPCPWLIVHEIVDMLACAMGNSSTKKA